ncbi:hypothetical protein HMPREF3034_02001 [Prevotella sp. DNF00663]|nr:hypothetical protein HMPREF3034_02001 [Prevotella sp. DNF00663]
MLTERKVIEKILGVMEFRKIFGGMTLYSYAKPETIFAFARQSPAMNG